MVFAKEIELMLSSIVILLDSSALKTGYVKELEDRFRSIVDAGERVLVPEGAGQVLRIPKRHLEIVLTRNRWEFNLRVGTINEDVAQDVANAIHILAPYAENAQWKTIGYNYNGICETSEGKPAIQAIAESTLDIVGLRDRLGYTIKGSATWLYLDIENKNLWLRLEPRGGDRTSLHVWVYGNYQEDLQGQLPSEEQLRQEFLALGQLFAGLLRKL